MKQPSNISSRPVRIGRYIEFYTDGLAVFKMARNVKGPRSHVIFKAIQNFQNYFEFLTTERNSNTKTKVYDTNKIK